MPFLLSYLMLADILPLARNMPKKPSRSMDQSKGYGSESKEFHAVILGADTVTTRFHKEFNFISSPLITNLPVHSL